jgi:8-oxo-dGTP pyrophosphatase MutT (NUDIX family)
VTAHATSGAEAAAPVPAATVVLLRDGPDGVETLLLRRDARLAFGAGAWVFPGGRIEASDYPPGVDPTAAGPDAVVAAARSAAVRETAEEAGLALDADELVWFAHWTPNANVPRRFATWFFAARAPAGSVVIDDREIRAHEWVAPRDVLERHRAGETALMVPTWTTLEALHRVPSVDELLARLRSTPPTVYESKVARDRGGVQVALWDGDAGYASGDPDTPGPRHRLWMREGAWELERS